LKVDIWVPPLEVRAYAEHNTWAEALFLMSRSLSREDALTV